MKQKATWLAVSIVCSILLMGCGKMKQQVSVPEEVFSESRESQTEADTQTVSDLWKQKRWILSRPGFL